MEVSTSGMFGGRKIWGLSKEIYQQAFLTTGW
jgi:hypothetical protein